MNDSLTRHIADSLGKINVSNVTAHDKLVDTALKKYIEDPWYHDVALVLVGALIPVGVDIIKGGYKSWKERKTQKRLVEQRKFADEQQSKQMDLELIADVIPECAGLSTSLIDSLEQSLKYSLMFYRTSGYGNSHFKIEPDVSKVNNLRDKHEEYRQKFIDCKGELEKQIHRFTPIIGERSKFYSIVNGLEKLNPDFFIDMNNKESLSEKGIDWFIRQRETTVVVHVEMGENLMKELTHYMRSFRTAYFYSNVTKGNEVKEEEIDREFEKE